MAIERSLSRTIHFNLGPINLVSWGLIESVSGLMEDLSMLFQNNTKSESNGFYVAAVVARSS